jgi:hypothetical protein
VVQLFAIGELYATNSQQQRSELALGHDASTGHGMFFSTLVLLLCDPYRLRHEDVACLVKGLGRLSEHLRIAGTSETNYCIALDLSGRLPPLRYARQPEPAETEKYLQLDDFLLQVDRQGLPDDEGELTQWLITSLRELALKPPGREARRHERQKREADYHFVRGLERVHQRLVEIQTGRAAGEAPAAPTAGIVLDDEPQQATSVELGTPCRQIDQSPSGARFILSADTPAPPVGCWVLLEAEMQDGTQAGRGFIARVRRCLKYEQQGTEIGTEKLLGSVIPVTFGLGRQRGLLYANREQRLFQLIAPPGSFEGPEPRTLHGITQDYAVMLEELLERNSTERIRLSLV